MDGFYQWVAGWGWLIFQTKEGRLRKMLMMLRYKKFATLFQYFTNVIASPLVKSIPCLFITNQHWVWLSFICPLFFPNWLQCQRALRESSCGRVPNFSHSNEREQRNNNAQKWTLSQRAKHELVKRIYVVIRDTFYAKSFR